MRKHKMVTQRIKYFESCMSSCECTLIKIIVFCVCDKGFVPVFHNTYRSILFSNERLFNFAAESDTTTTTSMIPETQKGSPLPPAPPHLTEEGLIIPRKPHNPILENTERQNLHRELLFNQKM